MSIPLLFIVATAVINTSISEQIGVADSNATNVNSIAPFGVGFCNANISEQTGAVDSYATNDNAVATSGGDSCKARMNRSQTPMTRMAVCSPWWHRYNANKIAQISDSDAKNDNIVSRIESSVRTGPPGDSHPGCLNCGSCVSLKRSTMPDNTLGMMSGDPGSTERVEDNTQCDGVDVSPVAMKPYHFQFSPIKHRKRKHREYTSLESDDARQSGDCSRMN